ncbi:MAG: amidohydrolase family protein [Pseudomonadota bacterium]
MVFRNDDWLSQVREDVVEPDREIVDPHHHLWPGEQMGYDLPEFLADMGAGHRVVETVFMECGSAYREDGADHLKPIGETEYVAAAADQAAAQGAVTRISAIVGRADLAGPHLDEVLDAHTGAAGGRFRGIRHAGARAEPAEAFRIKGDAPEGLYGMDAFRKGVARLGERGLTYDTWHYHYQNEDFLDLARAVPSTTMVLDHFGTPVGIGPYAGQREAIFGPWKDHMAAIAECPNVVAKLGGLAMPDNGFGWDTRDTPATSDEIVEAHAPWYTHMLDCFGADRCMFESNFPVDRWSMSYTVYWNAMKKLVADRPEAEKAALFAGTARRTYRL